MESNPAPFTLMQSIVKYKAYDGSEFYEPVECTSYENRCRRADVIVSNLIPQPKEDNLSFQNGNGYIQQDPETVKQVRRELLMLALETSDHAWLRQSLDNDSLHPSFAARIIGDGCRNGQLERAWNRIACIDASGREWGQQFYRENPDKAQQTLLNP